MLLMLMILFMLLILMILIMLSIPFIPGAPVPQLVFGVTETLSLGGCQSCGQPGSGESLAAVRQLAADFFM